MEISKIALGILFLSLFGHFYFHKNKEIQKIYSFNEINFSKIEADTLVVFDVDETLIQPTDTYFINEKTPEAQKLKQKLFSNHPEIKDWTFIEDIILTQVNRPLIESDIIEKINDLKKNNIKVIALTAMNTGKYGNLIMEQWRYEHLKSLGFEGSFQNLIIPLNLLNRHPIFYKGILATDLLDKGPVLGAFLDQMNWHPNKVIFIDDDLDLLKSVQEECKKRGIQFQGYQYLRARSKPWNEKLVEFQTNYLVNNKKWLSDEDAILLLQHV